MAHLRFFVILVLAVLGCATLIDSAAIGSEDWESDSGNSLKSENLRSQRDTSSVSQPQTICDANTPCKWAVYIPFTKTIDKFVENKCICAESLSCKRTNDDLSVNAYVYRCGSSEVTEFPET